mgnify:CR=1 FL=1
MKKEFWSDMAGVGVIVLFIFGGGGLRGGISL